MAKAVNKTRGEVPLPCMGEGCYLYFSIDAMEKMSTAFEGDWIAAIIEQTGQSNIPTFRTVIEAAAVNYKMHDEHPDLSGLTGNLMVARDAIIDAIFLAVHGRTFEEQRLYSEEEEAKEMQRQVERLEKNPQLAAAFLKQFEKSDTEQDSNQQNSVA